MVSITSRAPIREGRGLEWKEHGPLEVGILAVPSTQEVPRRSVFHGSKQSFYERGGGESIQAFAAPPLPVFPASVSPSAQPSCWIWSLESTCSRDLELYFWPCKAPLPGWLGTYQILRVTVRNGIDSLPPSPYSFKGFFFFCHLKKSVEAFSVWSTFNY